MSSLKLYILSTLLLLGIVSFAFGASKDLPSKASHNPPSLEHKVHLLMSDLQDQGFEVAQGYFKLWRAEDCYYTYERMGSCFGNNPAAPYVTFAVPPWPEEFVDPVTSNLWGPSKPGYIDVFRFDPREAIVILGQMPPPAAYFSEQTYLFSRKRHFDKKSDTYKAVKEELPYFLPFFFSKVPGNPDRIEAFATLSNPINNVVIENQSGTVFDEARNFIITPDQYMDQAVREAFARISIKTEDVFTEQIPSDMEVGLDRSSDDFATFFRYAQPADGGEAGTDSDAWRNELPMFVLRVRDARSSRETVRYPAFGFDDLEERTANDEWQFEDDLGRLLAAVSQRWGQPCANIDCSDRTEAFINLQTAPANLVGPLCNQIGENCAGDNWDTAYQLYGPMPLDNGEIYAVAGTLGTQTENATYVGLGINQVSNFNGVANISDKFLKDTARKYEREVNNTDKFFIYYFTRDCSKIKDLTDDHCFELNDYIPLGDKVTLTIRDYLVPNTQRGPDSQHVLPSKVLKLDNP